MILSEDIKLSVQSSVLCWLATANSDGLPNVSPKEIFIAYQDSILVANIASPNTLKNIKENQQVCISFINVYVQKGWQIKGTAKVLYRSTDNDIRFQLLDDMTGGSYPFNEIFAISPTSTKEIIAPSYFMFPDETIEEKIDKARKAYDQNLL